AMVFQSYALYPHMTVAENMGYGLKVNKVPKDQIRHQVEMVAKTLQLSHLLDRKPKQLSGGQRQRAWIAMVLAQETSILLLDEPTTWLDISHQIDLLELLCALNREQGYTLAAVLHDLNQACRYANHLIALRDGKIIAEGAPSE
ncbi:ATP-binding cassette domain-containing protein, partial [Leptospira borgpetersenii serovar Hardjo-bovis]|nr:ATP-binding cassette domain-containing protein [Leptospira borgpetersenii serovar Hardjo-bovis]